MPVSDNAGEASMSAAPAAIRHFTATGFVVWDGRVLLHWHRKERLWLPMGGHVEANEDPVQCVLREVEEEAGFPVELFGSPPRFVFTTPRQLPPPVTILLESVIGDGVRHEHIDLLYFCRPLTPPPAQLSDPTMRWLDAAALEANEPLSPDADTPPAAIPDDVRLPALEALRRAREIDG